MSAFSACVGVDVTFFAKGMSVHVSISSLDAVHEQRGDVTIIITKERRGVMGEALLYIFGSH